MYVHLGTYDGGIVSFQGSPSELRPTNNFQACQNSIRTLHRTGKYLIAGGFDGTLYIYDVLRNREEGEIEPEQGSISQLVSDGSILISAGDQGSIKMWKMGSFEFLHQLKEHKGQIQHLTVDTSGRIMFSVGKDRKLVMWNLLKAVRIFDRKLDFEVSKVLLTSDRQRLVLFSQHQIRVVETESNNEVSRVQVKERMQDCAIYMDRYLIVGNEAGDVTVWAIDKLDFSLKFKAADARVKCLAIVKLNEQDVLLTASSNGQMAVWDVLSLLQEMDQITQNCDLEDLTPLRKVEVGQRIICMIAGPLQPKQLSTVPKAEPVGEVAEVKENKKKHKKARSPTPAQEQVQPVQPPRKKKIHKQRDAPDGGNRVVQKKKQLKKKSHLQG